MVASRRFHPYDDKSLSCERTCAELLIYPGDMTPDEVTQTLGISPSMTGLKRPGQTSNYSSKVGMPKPNFWGLSSEENVESKDLRRHLDWLLDLLDTAKEGLKIVRRRDDCKMYVQCIWWAGLGGGPILWPEHMRRLSALDLEVAFSFADYNDGDDDVE